MRIAAIDVGANSIHMIVVQVRPDRSFEVVDREKEMVRLGSGGLGGRALTEAATTAALQTLSKFQRLAESHDVDEVVAAATSAVREADNGREFLEAIVQRTGIHVRVIFGRRGSEADPSRGGVRRRRRWRERRADARRRRAGRDRPQTEQFVRTDPIAERDVRRMIKHVEAEIADVTSRIVKLGFDRAIGTSGRRAVLHRHPQRASPTSGSIAGRRGDGLPGAPTGCGSTAISATWS